MVCPLIVQDDADISTVIAVYFPFRTWYDYYNGGCVHSGKGNSAVVTTRLNHRNMFVVNSSVFLTQQVAHSA
ncbi:hypothetical protein DAPPUDRAFT_314646 [Daphnia pulex]|uniref:Uncharacterized protein n=1 Tax=Daphnia pulex TaxID=6669 RepID=E9G709_DAPPU|nr:hypothetical protein DAPPUDRAFT_314646 [Daphnia pulex]|eukprot:EFX84379.1 hypothetical protein DAPPUDRAFT_314646 [Daphnia pulex]